MTNTIFDTNYMISTLNNLKSTDLDESEIDYNKQFRFILKELLSNEISLELLEFMYSHSIDIDRLCNFADELYNEVSELPSNSNSSDEILDINFENKDIHLKNDYKQLKYLYTSSNLLANTKSLKMTRDSGKISNISNTIF